MAKENKESKDSKVIVFIPSGARINIAPESENPPATEYNRREVVFDIEFVKKIVGGEYGGHGKAE